MKLGALLALPLLAVAGLTLWLALRGRDLHARLAAFLAERFQPRPDCPLPPEEGVVAIDCYDGQLDGRPISLLLSHEPGSRAVVWSYVGVYIPPPIDDRRLDPWRMRVRARGDEWAGRAGAPVTPGKHILVGPSEREPVRALRTPDGGAFIEWRLMTLPSREKLEERLAEVEATGL